MRRQPGRDSVPVAVAIPTLGNMETRIALLEVEMDHRRELFTNQFASAQKALEVASTANDKRLDGLNDLRKAMGDQADQMARRAEVSANLTALENKTLGELKGLRDKFEVAGRPNYFLGISALSSILVVIGGLWTVTGLKIENAYAPLVVSQGQFRTTQAAQDRELLDITSRLNSINSLEQTNTAKIGVGDADREQLNTRLRDLEHAIGHRNEQDHIEVGNLRSMITRLNVWTDMIHAQVFPKTPTPPLKQP